MVGERYGTDQDDSEDVNLVQDTSDEKGSGPERAETWGPIRTIDTISRSDQSITREESGEITSSKASKASKARKASTGTKYLMTNQNRRDSSFLPRVSDARHLLRTI